MSYFLLIAPGRSASTSLRLTIASTKQAMCHGEMLGKNRILGVNRLIAGAQMLADLRRSEPEWFMRLLLENEKYDMRGFKALYSHFFLDQNARALDWILTRKPKVVFVWRRNLVKRFESECRKKRLEGTPDVAKFNAITADQIVADAQAHIRMAQDIRARLGDHGITEILDIDFEHMIKGPEAFHSMMAFLDLAKSGYEIRTDKRTQRNQGAEAVVETPASFGAPEVQRFADVTLTQALDYASPGLRS